MSYRRFKILELTNFNLGKITVFKTLVFALFKTILTAIIEQLNKIQKKIKTKR